jgi:hypothetical protein
LLRRTDVRLVTLTAAMVVAELLAACPLLEESVAEYQELGDRW